MTLGLKDHHGVLRLCEVVRAGNAAIGGGTDKAAGATGAAGREFRGGYSGARLIGTVNLGDHNCTGTNVQRLIDPDIRPTGNANHRADAGHIGGADQILQIFKCAGAMFHIQQHKIISGVTGSLHKGGVGGNHKGAESTLLRCHGSLEVLNAFQCRHSNVSFHNNSS